MQAIEPDPPPSAALDDPAAPAVLLLAHAFRFAAARHAPQRRKGSAAEPYLNHLAEVADLVATATGGADPQLVAAALLHDVVEDTTTTLAEVEALFGADVAGLVAEATDDKSLPKAERKRLQVVHAPTRSPRAKILKTADKISNLRALAASPPTDWNLERRWRYVDWARAVVTGLRGVNPWLDGQFDQAAAAAGAVLGCPDAPAGGSADRCKDVAG
jgi:(p)ppGpp synthase/HD superfamily hydrolase